MRYEHMQEKDAAATGSGKMTPPLDIKQMRKTRYFRYISMVASRLALTPQTDPSTAPDLAQPHKV